MKHFKNVSTKINIYFKKCFIYLKGRETDMDRERSCILWFTPQRLLQLGLGQDETRSPELHLGLPKTVAGTQQLEPSAAASAGDGTGSKAGTQIQELHGMESGVSQVVS